MAIENTYQAPNKILLVAAFAAVFAIAGSASVLYYLGTFSAVTLQKTELPSYHFAYVLNTGPYNKIDDVFDNVKGQLAENNIQPINAAAVFLDDPSVVAGGQLRSKVGFVISRYDQLPDALQAETWESVDVIQAKFKGSPVVGSSKQPFKGGYYTVY